MKSSLFDKEGDEDFCPVCFNGEVDCVEGYVRDTEEPCTIACGGSCCEGTDACTDFTGVVCKDGSCGGDEACRSASIPKVIDSCKGDSSCELAGSNGGKVGSMLTSCQGSDACRGMGSFQGETDYIRNSCMKEKSCEFVGQSGSIGIIDNSCRAEGACKWAGNGDAHAITTDLKDCCNDNNECFEAAQETLPAECGVMVSSD